MNAFLRAIEPIVYPVGLLWALLLLGGVHFHRRKESAASRFCLSLAGLFWIAGSTPIWSVLIARIEKPFAAANVRNAASAQAAVVLGGITESSSYDTFGFSLSASGSRLITGIELLRSGKVNTIAFAGGPAFKDGQAASEGAVLKRMISHWNLATGNDIIALDPSDTTREEARHFQRLMLARDWTNVIVVTSAYHMPRSLATFRAQGIAAHPVACDFIGLADIERDGSGISLIPSAERLRVAGRLLHEVFGLLYYKIRGWA